MGGRGAGEKETPRVLSRRGRNDGETEECERKGTGSARILFLFSFAFRVKRRKGQVSGRRVRTGRRKSDRRTLSRSEKGGNRAGSIGGNPSGRVSRFAEHEILPVSSLPGLLSKSGPLFLPPCPPHARSPSVGEDRRLHVHVLTLLCPLPLPPSLLSSLSLPSSLPL